MPQLLSLSRAARLADVSRAELQKRIRRGELETFEGQIDISDLLRVYPQVSLDRNDAFERVERIKADAVPRSHEADTVLPSPRVLVSRLRSLSDVLVAKAAALDAAERLLDEVAGRIAQLAQRPSTSTSELRQALDWLAEARRVLAEPPPDSSAQLFAKDTFLRILAASVKIIPSGHEFFVEGTESILDASVRAGLKLAYGCASGNCGSCKARVVSGEVWKTRDHDYVLSERERQMGYILSCSNTAVTELVLEAAEALTVQDLPQQEIRAAVRKVSRIADDMAQLEIQTPRTHTLRFMAGQRAHLTLESGPAAELPIASCPCNARNLLFFVRENPANPFAAAVFSGELHHGQLVTVTGPRGGFVLHEDSPEPAVFIAFGDGIAPIKSLIEHAVSIDTIDSFHLYWVVSGPEGQYQARWCRAMKESLDNFAYTPLIGVGSDDLMTVLRADHPEPEGLRWYLAGPQTPVEALAEGLKGIGVDGERIAVEAM
ncbi:MAG: 2Fe-2S iron-sulfur cluster-binding protein [Chromatiaceae bacterium]|jgi:CDP-4-dehydro-6-deoxyglucose reductase|nr:2Fe-2S iron-sulfur cluster-binding protein [Chromatiaceae bacterium]